MGAGFWPYLNLLVEFCGGTLLHCHFLVCMKLSEVLVKVTRHTMSPFFVIEKYINAQFNHYDKLHKVKDSIKFFTVLIY